MASFPHDMSNAPRDGTTIEIECSYGIMPHYDIYKWHDGRWQCASDPAKGLAGETSCRWRPYGGNPAAYVDPTGGAQNTSAYWLSGSRVASARSGGAVLMPGASMSVNVPIQMERSETPASAPLRMQFEDISAEVFGKYQHCTKAKDGMWYADSDFGGGGGCGPLKRGALPAPSQDTPELTARAREMHERAAARSVKDAMPRKPTAAARPSFFRRMFGIKTLATLRVE